MNASPNVRRIRIADLDTLVVQTGSRPSIMVVLCHGYGASCEDLAPLSIQWIESLGVHSDRFQFIFPNAPHSLAEVGMPDGRAWWPINIEQLAAAVATSSFDQLYDHEPPGIDSARQSICDLMSEGMSALRTDQPAAVLGGFSQGAMLTMDVALRGDVAPPARLFQFSGTLVCKTQWERRVTRLKETPVFQSHGTNDPLLPFTAAQALRDLLVAGGVQVEFHAFTGGHTIDMKSIERTGMLLRDVGDVLS